MPFPTIPKEKTSDFLDKYNKLHKTSKINVIDLYVNEGAVIKRKNDDEKFFRLFSCDFVWATYLAIIST